MNFVLAVKKELAGMRYDLKKETEYYRHDIGTLWRGNRELLDYVRAPVQPKACEAKSKLNWVSN